MLLKERFQITRPLEEMELRLVRASLANAALVDPREEAILRTALSLARLYKVRHGERDVGVGALLTPFREEVERRLGPVLKAPFPPTRDRLMPHVKDLRQHAAKARDMVAQRLRGRVPPRHWTGKSGTRNWCWSPVAAAERPTSTWER
ncbi:hypothetical protein QEG98_15975 [Myxococcus sp. MxC21-1]|uniref:hypothetical protein n=1 Tax=Myxococcus sp. MxC21-1 TaxID=3041439 RepID=UPI0029312BB3|nr:hypothetical protein [Myxococcus sp. MxC21-1]WNZ65008.1 hypothetical protein QEG98_15975 [Myxococcus sp. MxC21-1]